MKHKPAIGKKGIFFTSIAILISAVLILTFSVPTTVTTKDQIPLTQAKAEAASSQARELKNGYLPQSLHIASYSAFYAMAEYMQLKRGYFATEEIFGITLKEIIVNGTMCCDLPSSPVACEDTIPAQVEDPSRHIGVDACIGKPVMRDRNLTKRLQDMENASFTAFRINTTFYKDYNSMALAFYQDNNTGPWQVGVNITVNYSIVVGDVMINKTENITTMFRIDGIPDPLYLVESQRTASDGNVLYSNYFNLTNITEWNISTFYHEAEWRLYRHDKNASSFLMRFSGQDSGSNCCGIESIINPLTMASVNGLVEKPYVDWCYYGTANRCTGGQAGSLWNVTCVTKTDDDGTKFFKFAIDTYHALQYNLTNNQKDYLYGAEAPPGSPPPCPEILFP